MCFVNIAMTSAVSLNKSTPSYSAIASKNLNNNMIVQLKDLKKTTLCAKQGDTKKKVVQVMAKQMRIAPLGESNGNTMQHFTSNNSQKIFPVKMENTGKLTRNNASAQAVARRNARERNRVKLVNDAFDTLRDRIPEDIIEAFDVKGGGRSAAKKFNKVQTLNMAAKYIMMMKSVLESDDSNDTLYTSSTTNTPASFEEQASVITMTPPPDDIQSSSDFEGNESILMDTSLAEITVVNGVQYVRVPGTNMFTEITSIYDKEENVQPLQPISTVFNRSEYFHDAYAQNLITTSYLQPTTSLQTLSPDQILNIKEEQQCYITTSPYQPSSPPSSICDSTVESLTDPVVSTPSTTTTSQNTSFIFPNSNNQFQGVITLKTEVVNDNEILLQSERLAEQQIDWWSHTST